MDDNAVRAILSQMDQEENNWRKARQRVGELLKQFDELVPAVKKLASEREHLAQDVAKLSGELADKRAAHNEALKKESEQNRRAYEDSLKGIRAQTQQEAQALKEAKDETASAVKALENARKELKATQDELRDVRVLLERAENERRAALERLQKV